MEYSSDNMVKVQFFGNELTPWDKLDYNYYKNNIKVNIDKLKNNLKKYLDRNDIWEYNEYLEFSSEIQDSWEWLSPLFVSFNINSSEELRKTIEIVEPEVTNFSFWLLRNKKLYYRNKLTLNSLKIDNDNSLKEFKRCLELSILDSEMTGLHLTEENQSILQKLTLELQNYERLFETNIIDSRSISSISVYDKKELDGIPEDCINNAKISDNEYLIKMDQSIIGNILKYSKNPSLREKVFKISSTIASENSTNKKFDNSQIIINILKLKYEIAKLLGYKDVFDLQLQFRSMKDRSEVLKLIDNVEIVVKKYLEKEKIELNKFYKELGQKTPINIWDLRYYKQLYISKIKDIDEEKIREYFPISKVLTGFYKLIEDLFGITIKVKLLENDIDKEVKILELYEKSGEIIGTIYIDLYARDGKSSGAWACGLYGLRIFNNKMRRPSVCVNANISRPADKNTEAYVSHYEIVTIFHEMGHALQGILTKVILNSVSGMKGVTLDAVEVPSQLLENWAWEPSILKSISKHKSTGDKITDDLIGKLISLKKTFSGFYLHRQLTLSNIDLHIHGLKYDDISSITSDIINDIGYIYKSKSLSPIHYPDFCRPLNSFSHIFSGMYTAGYYSYLFCEMISDDIFAAFKEIGDIYNQELVFKLKNTFFAQGGAGNIIEQFKLFRGRGYSTEALLQKYGLC